MKRFTSAVIIALFVAICSTVPALADDWLAAKLRGTVLRLVDGAWTPLHRGDVVPNTDVIRTLANGSVQFTRDAEVIDLGPNTQIQIFDKNGQRFTTVKQYFGTVAIEANVENVQHFAVQTPLLAAVVKGTKFVVTSGKDSASVKVLRGHVAVENLVQHSTVTVSEGQTAQTSADEGLVVGGAGDLPAVAHVNDKASKGSKGGNSGSSGANDHGNGGGKGNGGGD